MWNINQDGIDILIDYKHTAKAKDFISKTDYTYNIMIDDVETAIDETYVEVNNSNTKMPWLERECKYTHHPLYFILKNSNSHSIDYELESLS